MAACSGASPPQEQDAEDERAIAAVRDAQRPPPEPLDLQPITFADIEREDLFGAGCVFMPDGSTRTLALAQVDRGALKLDGRVVRFAPDAGSSEHPYGTRARYTGPAHSFRLTIASDAGRQSGYETTDYPGELEVRDRYDRVLMQMAGRVQCGA
ncbi:hypothetical protein EYB45_06500 [Erythrobacteraceae bacterium CFH 75059]|uniref:hypothetical protein n=1 Tax=Qipengyuania thermophila TaxID=2509361 RepID=UPI0010D5AA05|nr:hypothetical protein [Qipengyuania thermophila]TCD05147.1 hypothetical protein EYB45_06500 [Erythrobacteraceae bacterium CFH 75059]